jgi:glycosyltransferase involved in cell wall biosynthesis
MAAPWRVALAHHWMVSMRGGEKVFEQIGEMFPGAPIHTLVADSPRLTASLRSHPLHTSPFQRMPGGLRHYKKLLPLFPWAVKSLKVRGPVDLVISSDASVIKGLTYPADVPHVCYCHSPPRYLWDLQEDYTKSSEVGGPLGRMLFNRVVPHVRAFDRRAAGRVTHFIANSDFVRKRIEASYGRESEIIYPPVALDDFAVATEEPESFYLVVSQLAPYKRIDVAIEAFNRLKKPLVVIGEGSERARLESGSGPTITFLGSQSQAVLRDHFRRCRALIFPGIEDFGITPLEAQASGRPVLAYRAGGVLETIRENVTGLFFDEQTPESLIETVERFESARNPFDPRQCRESAERFSPVSFRAKLSDYLARHLGARSYRS